MIDLLRLAIEDNGTTFSLECQVSDEAYFKDVYLDKILIDTQDTYNDSGPSSSAYTLKTFTGKEKSFSIEKDTTIPLDLKHNILFVWICTKGTPSADTPCGKGKTNTIGVAVYIKEFYESLICVLKDITNKSECHIPKEFITKYLQFKGFIYALEAEHYTQACEWYKNFFLDTNTTTLKSTCSCGK